MKKFFLIAASAMMVLASCTKVVINYPEDAQPQEIAMFAVNKSATKTPLNGGSTFPTNYDMMVAAYLASGAQNAGDYFEGTLFTNTSTENVTTSIWTGGKYWPVSTSAINFLAVTTEPENNSPYTGSVNGVTFGSVQEGATASSNFASKAVVTFAGNETTDKKFNQFDLMYAAGQGIHNEGENYQDVSMTFKHALSWIKFTVATNVTNTSKNDNTFTMTVNSIRLSGASYGGTLTIDNSSNYATTPANNNNEVISVNTNVTTGDCTWSGQTAGVSDVYVPNANGDAQASAVTGLAAYNATAQAFGNGLLVVPVDYSNEADNSRPTITINYTMNQGNGDYTFERTIEIPQINWEANKIYTYALTITLQKIEIEPKVGEWLTHDNDGEAGNNNNIPVVAQ